MQSARDERQIKSYPKHRILSSILQRTFLESCGRAADGVAVDGEIAEATVVAVADKNRAIAVDAVRCRC